MRVGGGDGVCECVWGGGGCVSTSVNGEREGEATSQMQDNDSY